MNINSDISEIHDILHQLEKPSADVKDLDKKVQKVLSNIKLDLSQVYEGNFLIRRDMVGTLAELQHTVKKLSEKLSNLQLPELTKKVKKTQDILTLVANAGVKDKFDPFSSEKTRDFYLTYSYRDFLRGKVWRPIMEKEINWQECVRDPHTHPEWPIFQQEMKKVLSDEKVIDTLWQLTVEGIDFQLKLNEKNQKKESNPFYERLAGLLDEHHLLAVKPGESLALWSGGYAVSLFAQQSHHTTIEKTDAGHIFYNLLLYPSWAPLGPLWNALSTKFCSHAEGKIHVYFRVQAPRSVLERKELMEIAKSKKVEKISFHPLHNRGPEALDELDLVVVPILYATSVHPKVQLKNVLVELCQQYNRYDEERIKGIFDANIRAINKMKLE